MHIVSTTLCYPTPNARDQGVFIQRRVAALNARSDTDVTVVAPQLWCPVLRSSARVASEIESPPVAYPRMVSIPMVGWATDGVAYAASLARAIRRADIPCIDLIDAHFVYPDGVGAWLAGRRLGIPVVVTVRGKIVSLSRRAIRRRQIVSMLRGVQGRIAVSRSLADWVHRLAGNDLPVDVIPNGVEKECFHRIDCYDSRIALGWDPNARYLLAVGHLQHVKGFDRIIAILPALRAHFGDVRLVLAGSRRGEGWFRQRLRWLAARCGGEPAVSYVGTVSSAVLNRMYNAADVFICPSRSEGWSNAIAESLACGTPVVATDVGGNAEQVCHPDLGRIVPDDNESALAASIAAALLRSWNRDVIASHGQQRNWTTVAAEVHQVFARILEQPTTTPVRNRATSIQPASPPALAVETFPLEAME